MSLGIDLRRLGFNEGGEETRGNAENVQDLWDGEGVAGKEKGIMCMQKVSHELELINLLLDGVPGVLHTLYRRTQDVC